MRNVIAHLIMTLDGVVKFDSVVDTIVKLRDRPEVLSDFFAKVVEEDAMLLGRVTYQEWADYWPTSTNEPFASHINAVPKYVASRSLSSAPWGTQAQATLLKGELTQGVNSLKQQPGRNIGVHGSPSLVQFLLQADLLDVLRIELYPLVAGSGARLFERGMSPKRLTLEGSKTTESGVVLLTYRR
jgi:dihydrofolate reductase